MSCGTARNGTTSRIASPRGPSCLSEGLDKALVDTFLYRLYGMYLAVLVACMAACQEVRDNSGRPLSCVHRNRGSAAATPWANQCGPLPRPQRVPALRMRPGMPPGFRRDWNRPSPTTWSDGQGPWYGNKALETCRGLCWLWILRPL